MTVPSSTQVAGPFYGNGVTTSFPFTFKCFDKEHLRFVVATDGVEVEKVLDSDYSVTLNSDQDASPGGSVTYPISGSPMTSDSTASIEGAVPLGQGVDLPDGGAFNASDVERALDILGLQNVQQQDQINRSLRLPVTAASADAELPPPDPNSVIGWDSAGAALRNFSPETFASVVAYSNRRTLVGDGGAATYTLDVDPGSVHNTLVAVGGVVQTPGVDYTVSGVVLTPTTPWPAGTDNVVIIYGEALPVGTLDAGDVNYDPTASYTEALGLFLNNVYARTAAEVAASVTPTSYFYAPGDIRRYGGTGDGTTDDTTALQRWAAVDHPHYLIEGKTYKLTGALTLPAVLDGRGATISCTSTATLSRVGTLTQIADLSVSPSAGDQTLTFASAHGLSIDDVVVIYNPTNSSWNSARTYYRAGEFCRAATVPSTTTIDLAEPLHAAYTAANVDVYKMTRNEVIWSNLNVLGPDATVSALRLALATRATLRNVRVNFASYLGIYIDRCLDYELHGCSTNVPKTAISDCYGLLHGNSQNGKVIGGSFYSLRNSIDHGGDDVTGCVPVRNVVHTGCTIRNDNGVAAEAANTHANAVGIRFESCFIQGGASLNGRDVEYVDCTIGGAPAGLGHLVGGGSEMIGGRYSISNCKLKAGGAYSVGLVRAYNGANATEVSHLIVEDNDVDMGSCDTYVRTDVVVATYKSNARVDGVVFTDGATSLANVLRMVGTGSGGDGDYVIVDRVTNGPAGAVLYFAASSYGATVKCRLQEQRGSVAITPVSAAASANAATQTFRYSYGSKTPICSVSLLSGVVNSKTVIGYPSSVSATAVIPTMRTADSANFGVTSPDVTAHWTAAVAEI